MGKWEIGEMGPTAKGEPSSNLNFDVSRLKGVVIKGLLFAVGAVVLWNTVLPSPKAVVVAQTQKKSVVNPVIRAPWEKEKDEAELACKKHYGFFSDKCYVQLYR